MGDINADSDDVNGILDQEIRIDVGQQEEVLHLQADEVDSSYTRAGTVDEAPTADGETATKRKNRKKKKKGNIILFISSVLV